MSRSSHPPQSKTLKGQPYTRGTTIGFWIFSGFLIGLGTSIGARILLCPHVGDLRAAPLPAVVAPPAVEPTAAPLPDPSVPQDLLTARAILSAAVDGDGRWTELHKMALQRQIARLPESEAHEIVHEMVVAFHSGKLRPE